MLTILTGLIECIDWVIKLSGMLLDVFTYIHRFLASKIKRCRRCIYASVIRDFRKVSCPSAIIPIKNNDDGISVVGITKTVFIKELPEIKEPEPFDKMELPLDNYEEEPVIDPDEIDIETTTKSVEEVFEELGGNDLYDNIPVTGYSEDEVSSGASIEELGETYATLNVGSAPLEKERKAAAVLNNLNGSDIFKFFIIHENCNRRAKELMDKNFDAIPVSAENSSFDISKYVD